MKAPHVVTFAFTMCAYTHATVVSAQHPLLQPAPLATASSTEERASGTTVHRCVLWQCVNDSATPPGRLFSPPVTIWTSIVLVGAVFEGMRGPLHHGFDSFHVTNEGYFQSSTYAGGADKASHIVLSANTVNLLYDAYSLNGLTGTQSRWLSFATTIASGTFVEIADGFTVYGFSSQDLIADAVGAFTEVAIKSTRIDDVMTFRVGWVPTDIPPARTVGHTPMLGVEYSDEIFTADLKVAGLLARRNSSSPIGRALLVSFAFMTKGFGYAPPLSTRYQQVGVEVGVNIPELLKSMGVSSRTAWGDLLLRCFSVFRVPFTQIGLYYNLTNHQWYGPGSPYRFH